MRQAGNAKAAPMSLPTPPPPQPPERRPCLPSSHERSPPVPVSTKATALDRRAALFALMLVVAALPMFGAAPRPALAGQTTFVVTKTADTNDGSCEQDDCSLR